MEANVQRTEAVNDLTVERTPLLVEGSVPLGIVELCNVVDDVFNAGHHHFVVGGSLLAFEDND